MTRSGQPRRREFFSALLQRNAALADSRKEGAHVRRVRRGLEFLGPRMHGPRKSSSTQSTCALTATSSPLGLAHAPSPHGAYAASENLSRLMKTTFSFYRLCARGRRARPASRVARARVRALSALSLRSYLGTSNECLTVRGEPENGLTFVRLK